MMLTAHHLKKSVLKTKKVIHQHPGKIVLILLLTLVLNLSVFTYFELRSLPVGAVIESTSSALPGANLSASSSAELVSQNVLADSNLALNRLPVNVSSTASSSNSQNAVDGNDNTYWESSSSGRQTFGVDLGADYVLGKIHFKWVTPYHSTHYNIFVSDNSSILKPISTVENGQGDDTVQLTGTSGRFITIETIAEASPSAAYRLASLEVYPLAVTSGLSGSKIVPDLKGNGGSCILDAVSWSVPEVEVTAGTKVEVKAVGRGDCSGRSVNFEVRRNGSSFDDIPATIQPATVPFSGSAGQVVSTWTTEYKPLNPGTDPEYYFKATLSGAGTFESDSPRTIKVVQAAGDLAPSPTPTNIPTPTTAVVSPLPTTVPSVETPSPSVAQTEKVATPSSSVTPTAIPSLSPSGSSEATSKVEENCTLTSATWDAPGNASSESNQRAEGGRVVLHVSGKGHCNGQTISFKVLKHGGALESFKDADVTANPPQTVFRGNEATSTWTAEYVESPLSGIALISRVLGNPEYYFKANLVGGNGQGATIQSSTDSSLTLQIAPVSGLTLSSAPTVSPQANAAFIEWTTNRESSSEVEYGLTTSYGKTTGKLHSEGFRLHPVDLDHLQECTTYQYRIKSEKGAGVEAVSTNQTFTTKCSGGATVLAQGSNQLTFASGGKLALVDSHSRGLDLTIPPYFARSDADFQIKKLERDSALRVNPLPTGKAVAADHLYHLSALIDPSTPVGVFNRQITIKISYTPTDITGITESTLSINHFDGTSWTPLTNCTTETLSDTLKAISCQTTSFSDFALVGVGTGAPISTITTQTTSTIQQTLVDNDWPQLQRDPQRTGYSPIQINGPYALKWKWNSDNHAPIRSSVKTQPVVSSGRMFFGGFDGKMYAVDTSASTGNVATTLWQFSTGGSIFNTAAVDNNTVFFGSDDGYFYAVDATATNPNGTLIWKYKTGAGIWTAPLVVGNTVYFGSRDGFFYALNEADGSVKWRYGTGAPILHSAAYSAKHNLVYFGAENMNVYAIDATSGSQRWMRHLEGESFRDSWPVVQEANDVVFVRTMPQYPASDMLKNGANNLSNVRQYLASNPSRVSLFALDSLSGSNKYSQPLPVLWTGGSSGAAAAPTINGDNEVFVITRDASAYPNRSQWPDSRCCAALGKINLATGEVNIIPPNPRSSVSQSFRLVGDEGSVLSLSGNKLLVSMSESLGQIDVLSGAHQHLIHEREPLFDGATYGTPLAIFNAPDYAKYSTDKSYGHIAPPYAPAVVAGRTVIWRSDGGAIVGVVGQ